MNNVHLSSTTYVPWVTTQLWCMVRNMSSVSNAHTRPLLKLRCDSMLENIQRALSALFISICFQPKVSSVHIRSCIMHVLSMTVRSVTHFITHWSHITSMLKVNIVWDMCVHTVVPDLIHQVRGQGMSIKITECLDLSRITMKLYCIILYVPSWMIIYIACLYCWFMPEVD